MSGVAVIWNRDGRPVDRAALQKMLDAMVHRGPDASGSWASGSVGIARCILHTTNESVAEEPLVFDETRKICLALDGRIDNRDELKTDLEGRGHELRADTDAELVLRAYQHWGDDCVTHLRGDFAFVIWDDNHQRLLCVRDHMGLKPFFYTEVGKTFIGASEIRPLFAIPEVKSEPNATLFACYLAQKCVEFDDTVYRGIFRIPLAQRLIVTGDRTHRERYWDIDPSRHLQCASDQEYGDHFRGVFEEAVRDRLRSNHPIAAMLSGGLDSSSIVCLAQKIRHDDGISQPPLESFSMVFDELKGIDERRYIDEVVRKSGVVANYEVCDRDLDEAAFERRHRYPDLPYSPQVMTMGPMLTRMRDRGFRVLLDGTGGDELAGPGYAYIAALRHQGKWLTLTAMFNETARNQSVSLWSMFRDYCIRPALPAPFKAPLKMLAGALRHPGPTILREDALEKTGARRRLEQVDTVPEFASPMHEEMYRAMFYGRGPTLATDGYELLGAYFGLELRQPCKDKRLVELAFSLPIEQLWRHGLSRFVLRTAMSGILPEAVRMRRGKGVFRPVYDAVLAGRHRREVTTLFEKSTLVEMGLADPIGIRNLMTAYLDAPNPGSTWQMTNLVALELRCRDIIAQR